MSDFDLRVLTPREMERVLRKKGQDAVRFADSNAGDKRLRMQGDKPKLRDNRA